MKLPKTRSPRLLPAALVAIAAGSACTTVQGVRTSEPEPDVRVSVGPVPETDRAGADPDAVRLDEVRGVWVVRTTLTSREQVLRMVRETHEAGFNTLLVQVRGRADAYYRSLYEPRAVQLQDADEEFDPLQLVLEEAHERGMKVHAWVVAQLVWGLSPLPEDPGHLVNVHPDWLAVPRGLAQDLYDVSPWDPVYRRRLHQWAVENGTRVEGLFASPGHPEVTRRLVNVVEDLLLRYPLDGIHLDYIRYPSPDFDYSRRTLEAFRAFAGRQSPPGRTSSLDARVQAGDVTAWARENPELWDRYRESQVTATLEAVRRVVDRAPGDPALTAAVFADPVDALRGRFQDWTEWLNGQLVDAVAPMAYTPDDERFADLMEAARRADRTGGGRVWAGVGIYQTDLAGAVRKVSLARAAGAAGFILFSYDWATSEGSRAEGTPYLDELARRTFPGREPRR